MFNRLYYEGYINKLESDQIFVFGSNPEGRHGKGAAKIAKDNFGANYGQGRGFQGQSYGLITKNLKAGYYEESTKITYYKEGEKSLSTHIIKDNINELYTFARENKDKYFFIAFMVGDKYLNGYSDLEMASIFRKANPKIPYNIIFEKDFGKLVFGKKKVSIYTDGACSNNGKKNAKAGIGIYFGEGDKKKVFIYTDGACSNNGKKNAKAGIGIYFGEGDKRNLSKRITGKQTNNTAEVKAIIEVYNIMKNEIEKGEIINIVSDSNYAIRAATDYGAKCEKKNFEGIVNADLIKIVYTLYKDKPNVKFLYIKAHTKNTDIHSIGNREADLLAVLSIQKR